MPILLKIRKIQIARELKDAGFHAIVFLGILVYAIYYTLIIYSSTPLAFWLTGSLFFSCLLLQSYRNDKSFVYNHIDKPHLEIYLEYLVATFPFIGCSLLTDNWYCFPLLVISLMVVPYLKYTVKQKTYFRNLSSIIPVTSFEWISGFRKSFLHLIPFYIVALCFSWVRIFPLFILWIILFPIISFYNECESLQVLKEGHLTSEKLINRKLYHHSGYLMLIYLPVLLINTIFNFDYWIFNLLFLLVQVSVLCFAICLKYSTYTPNKIITGNNLLLSITSIISIVPFLLPLPLIMTFRYYGKAKTNMNTYIK